MDEMRKVTACFTGHREINEPLEAVERRVTEAVEQATQTGYRYFGAGGARGFDALASEVVLKLKQKYPQIHLILVLPFDRQYAHEKGWTQTEVDQYERLKGLASKVVTLSAQYAPGIYYQRNRHLVDHSSLCIAYLLRVDSGTGYTVRYAERKRLDVVNLAAEIERAPVRLDRRS